MKKIILLLTLALTTSVVTAQGKKAVKKAAKVAVKQAPVKMDVKKSDKLVDVKEAGNHVEVHLEWEEYFKDALAKSKKEKKPILVFFTGSDWCGPCKKLHKGVFETLRFKKYADKYFILYQADFPRNKDLVSRQNKGFNDQLKKRFKQKSFPTVLVIDDNGNKLGKRDGLYDFESYYPFFDEIVSKIEAK